MVKDQKIGDRSVELSRVALAATPADLEWSDFMAGMWQEGQFLSSRCVMRPTSLDMSSRNQTFFRRARTLVETLDPDTAPEAGVRSAFQEALFQRWSYRDALPDMGFDPDAPPKRCNPAATWLAVEAVAALPWLGHYDHFVWPIWDRPVSFDAVRSLLRTPSGGSAERYFSRFAVVGEYGLRRFTPAMPWMSEKDERETKSAVTLDTSDPEAVWKPDGKSLEEVREHNAAAETADDYLPTPINSAAVRYGIPPDEQEGDWLVVERRANRYAGPSHGEVQGFYKTQGIACSAWKAAIVQQHADRTLGIMDTRVMHRDGLYIGSAAAAAGARGGAAKSEAKAAAARENAKKPRRREEVTS